MPQIFEDKNRKSNYYLTQTEAADRKELIKDVHYDVTLCMPKGEKFYGHVVVEFFLIKKDPSKKLYIDFRGDKIGKVMLNGVEYEQEGVFENHKILLEGSKLQEGQVNKLDVQIVNTYVQDGMGLHTFIDPEDKEQYLYTQFEPDYAHYVFPCFDQPDLKATWTFKSVVEGYWSVISNEAYNENRKDDHASVHSAVNAVADFFGGELPKIENPNVCIFKKSYKISTYLYAIVAGNYSYYEKNDEGSPNMRIYARKSLIKDVDHELMFMVTQEGIRFYEKFFGRAYPFNKYDQVFVPEHNAGAMENVGCVTYNEIYLFRGQTPSLAKKLKFSNTNLHELGHMWFGDLVTMKWWNDLWLNESFATFMSFLCMKQSEKMPEYSSCWVTFQRYKNWGLTTDQYSSTHPICSPVHDTIEAEQMFDGISYGKGSALLKQMFKVIGYETFSKGLTEYFHKYSWENTELPQFVECLSKAYRESGDKSMGEGFEFTQWCDTWLNSSGNNILTPEVEYNEDGSIKSLQIRQTCDLKGKNRLRMQKLDIALYDSDFQPHIVENVVISDTQDVTKIDVTFDKPVEIIYVNDQDHGYGKFGFDQKSVSSLIKNLYKIEDPLNRFCIWSQLWYQTLDRKISSVEYFEMVINQLPHEPIEEVLSTTLMRLSALIANYIPKNQIAQRKKQMFDTLLNLLAKPDLAEDVKSPIVDQIFGFVSEYDDLKLAIEWARKEKIYRAAHDESLYGLKKSHKYSVLRRVSANMAFTKAEKTALIDEIIGDDKSDLAIRTRTKCDAALPDADNKKEIWDEIIDQTNGLSMYEKEDRMAGFYNLNQTELLTPYYDKFYEFIPQLYTGDYSFKFKEAFFYSLLPKQQIKDSHIVALVQLKATIPENNKATINNLNDGIEQLIRIKLILERAQESKL